MVLLLVPETAVLFKKAKTSSETNLRNIDSKCKNLGKVCRVSSG